MNRRNIWKCAAAVVGLAAVLSPVACGQDASKEPIKIGHYGSLSGSEATFGESTDKGIRLAIKELNAAGGINGRKVELITYDDKGDSGEAGKAVTRLVTNDKVMAVLGEVASSLSLAGGAVCQQYKVPMISPSSTNLRVTANRDYVFRVCFTDDFQTYGIAKFVRESLKMSKAAILYDQKQAYSKGVRDDFTKAFKAMGGEIVADQAYAGGDVDYSAQLNTIKGAGAEILMVPGYYTEGANIAKQAKKAGLTIPLIGGDGWDSAELGKIAKDDIVGSYYSNHSAPDQPEMQSFIGKFKAEYGSATPDALAGLGYDAANLLFAAMKRAKQPDEAAVTAEAEKTKESPAAVREKLFRQNLRNAIASTVDYPGVTGKITIDENRNAKKALVIVQMKKNAAGEVGPSFVTRIEPVDKLPGAPTGK